MIRALSRRVPRGAGIPSCLRWRRVPLTTTGSMFSAPTLDNTVYIPSMEFRLIHGKASLFRLVVSTASPQQILFTLRCHKCIFLYESRKCAICFETHKISELSGALEQFLPHDPLTSFLEADSLIDSLDSYLRSRAKELRRWRATRMRAERRVTDSQAALDQKLNNLSKTFEVWRIRG